MKKNQLLLFLQKHSNCTVLLAYLALTIVFTFPLVRSINSQIPQGRGDTFQAMSNIDSRVATLAATQDFSHRLIFLVKNINTFLPYVILNTVVNKYLAYNLLFMASFVLSAVGMYLLALFFTRNKSAAFLAGLLFAFSPFHFYQATAVNLGTMQQQWLPFFVLFLFRFFQQFKFKYFAVTAFFAFLIAAAEHQFLAFTVLFVGIFMAYKTWEDRNILRNKTLWTYFAVSIGLLAIVAVGMFGQLLKVATSDNNFLDPGMNAANRYSMAMIDPLAPPSFQTVWPGANSALRSLILDDAEKRGSYFIGYTALAILGYLVYMGVKKRRQAGNKTWRFKASPINFWLLQTVIFYLFAMGPSFSIGKQTIYLPYFLVYKLLPFYENIRTTGRMFVFVLLGTSVLFAYGYVELLKRFKQRHVWVASAVFLCIMLEFWVAPMKTMTAAYSPFYDQLGRDGGVYKLIEIPGSTSYNFASYALFTDTIHKKSVLNGMPLARKISKQFAMQQNTPVIKQLLFTIPKGNDPDSKDVSDILPSFDYTRSTDLLNYYGVHYITISKKYASKDVLKMSEKFIQAHIAYVNRYEDNFLIAYEIKSMQPAGFFTELNYAASNKYSADFIGKDGLKNRELGDGAGLKIVNMEVAPQNVKITVSVRGKNGLIFSSPSDTTANGLSLLDDAVQQYSFITTLNPGDNIVSFSLHNEQNKVVNISNSKKKPTGALVSQILVQAL